MLLTADDHATFSARILQDGSRIWASYVVEGRIKGDPVQQSDKRMFASEQEAPGLVPPPAESTRTR